MYVENISFCEPSSAVFLNADAFHDNCTHQESFGLDLRQGFQCVMIVAMVCRYIHETARPAPLRAVFFGRNAGRTSCIHRTPSGPTNIAGWWFGTMEFYDLPY